MTYSLFVRCAAFRARLIIGRFNRSAVSVKLVEIGVAARFVRDCTVMWAVPKTVLMVLLGSVIGTITLDSIVAAPATVHCSFANTPRKRKPHVRYPVRDLF